MKEPNYLKNLGGVLFEFDGRLFSVKDSITFFFGCLSHTLFIVTLSVSKAIWILFFASHTRTRTRTKNDFGKNSLNLFFFKKKSSMD